MTNSQRQTSVVILANHNNGYQIVDYLSTASDTVIKLVVVLPEKPGEWWKSVKQLAAERKLPIHEYKSNKLLYSALSALPFDYLISANWRGKIPTEILALPKIGSINFHNGLLPQDRGVYANTWPLLRGETKTGITIHWMDSELDTGKIIAQEEVPLNMWDTAFEVWGALNDAFLNLFKKIWPLRREWGKLTHKQRGIPSYHSKKEFEKTNRIQLQELRTFGEFINFLRAKSFEPYYKNAFFIDPKTGKKIYVSINLSLEKG